MMSKEKRRVPKLRFPGFTEDWEQRKLGDLLILLKDGSHGTHKNTDEGVYLLSAKNIKNGQINIMPDDRIISWEDYDVIHKNYELQFGDILLTIVGSIGETAIYNLKTKVTFQRSVAFLRPSSDLNNGFLYTLINTDRFQNQLQTKQVVSAQPGIYLGDLASIDITYPKNLSEQEKIYSIFKEIENSITLHQRKLDNLKLKKKALLQKLFPKNGERYPELRFPGFTDAWEQRKFGEIYERAGQKNDLTYGIDKIISVANMYFKKDVTVGSEEYLKTYNVFKLGDIAFEGHTNKEYRYGRFVENTIGDGIVSHIFDVFTPKINLDINFWKDLIKYEPIMGLILRRCTKASRMMSNLTTKEFLEEQILCPTLEEQKLIGEFIVSLDKNITLHQRKLDHLQLQKKALLQQMFV